MSLVVKKIPDQNVIELLKKELNEYLIEKCKHLEDGKVEKKDFDVLKNLELKSNIDLGSSNNLKLFPERHESIYVESVKIKLGANECTNVLFYPKKSCMLWHTNGNNAGKRIYINFGIGKGIFRYIDPFTKKVIDDIDYEGWTQREFIISKENPLWHCVYAPHSRFSFGFNVKF
jgi:hypothetical protein